MIYYVLIIGVVVLNLMISVGIYAYFYVKISREEDAIKGLNAYAKILEQAIVTRMSMGNGGQPPAPPHYYGSRGEFNEPS